jgi:RNA polymerase sigma-70 factor (ECF subfamily)
MVFHGAPLRRHPQSPTPVPLISPHPDADSAGELTAATPAGEDRAELVLRLFREHNQALIGFLLGRVNSQQEAQEIAQEAYVRMLELDTAGAIGFLRAYLFKLAANLAVDRARQRATHTRLQETWVDPFEYLSQEPSAERGAAARQELQLVRRFMAELPPRCRVAFYLHRFRDRSVPDIAQLVGVTERMVRIYIQRALVHCRLRLDAARGQSGSPRDLAP